MHAMLLMLQCQAILNIVSYDDDPVDSCRADGYFLIIEIN